MALSTFCFGSFIAANILVESESKWIKFLDGNAIDVRVITVPFPQEDQSAATKTIQTTDCTGKPANTSNIRIDILSWRQLYL